MAEYRDYILIYLNGERRTLRGAQVFMTLAEYLREVRQLTGTKVVCAEGDCGACSVLVGAVPPAADMEAVQYQVVNACIQFMHGLDCTHIVTIEGLPKDQTGLHPIQSAMVSAQATQCGFCTPGFVMAAAGMVEHQGSGCQVSQQQAKNYLTGNLCRCTGYVSIINAMLGIDTSDCPSIKDHYHTAAVHDDLLAHTQLAVSVHHDGHRFDSPLSAQAAAMARQNHQSQIFAAATDLGVQHNKGHWQQQRGTSLNLIADLHQIKITDDATVVGARVTLTALESALAELQPEWADFMHVFASPQIKNQATLVGNVANGSPIGDNLPFLLVLDAQIHIQSPTDQRSLSINEFYTGYKQLNLTADEVITHISIPHKPADSVLKLYKVSQRRDLDISCVSAAFMVVFDQQQVAQQITVALGGVAATALRITEFESQLQGQTLTQLTDPDHRAKMAKRLAAATKPMSDVRGSATFRSQLVANLYHKFIDELPATLGATQEANNAI